MSSFKIYFLIPVYNEQENMPNLMSSFAHTNKVLLFASCHYVLLDDGSSDETVSTAITLAKKENLELQVLSSSQNEGPGAAFRRGFNFVASLINDQDLVVTIEGDNTSRCELLKTMIERMQREEYDVVLASPYAYGGGFTQASILRVVLSHFANGLTKIFLNIHGIHTFSSFFRIYNGKSIKTLQQRYGNGIIKMSGFESMVELLAKSVHTQLKITEVPMSVDWGKRKGKSKMKIFKTIRGYLKLFYMAKKIISNH